VTDITLPYGTYFVGPDGRMYIVDGEKLRECELVSSVGWLGFAGGSPEPVGDPRELPRNFAARPPRDYAERLLGMMGD
jgi:hypothetical protein